MTVTSGPLHSKGSPQQAKNHGWAAFDLKHRQSQGKASKTGLDPYPPLPPSGFAFLGDGGLCGDFIVDKKLPKHQNADSCAVQPKDISFKSLDSSAKSPASAIPYSAVVQKFTNQADPGNGSWNETGWDHSNMNLTANNVNDKFGGLTTRMDYKQAAVEELKSFYSWADDSLIEDVLMALDYDCEQASASLESMAVTNPLQSLESSMIGEAVDSSAENSFQQAGQICLASSKFLGSAGLYEMNTIECLPTAPPEPEWEESDMYLKHRKGALQMLRAGCRHSGVARNAFLRGDHHTAKLASIKAREERLAADELNAKAAAEILRIRNDECQNDIWKLDLHGLHASEAVCAVALRLEMIEYEISSNTSVSCIGRMGKEGSGKSSTVNQALGKSEKVLQKTDEHGWRQSQGMLSIPTWRQSELQVITGVGVHSRGGVALPTTIKSFLIDRKYRFNDARPGVIAIHPKYRFIQRHD